MQKLISIALTIILCMPFLLKTGILVRWKINQDSIIKMFCENKDKPEMQCHAQCFLQKELKKIEEPTRKASLPETIKKIEISAFIYQKSYFNLNNNLITVVIFTTHQESVYSFDFIKELFHPPQENMFI